MGKLSYDDYMSMKKKGLVKWDEDLINSHSKNVNEFLKGTSNVSAESFDGLKSRIKKLDDDNEYVRTYINSLSGSDGYEDASKAFEGLDSAFGNARKLYDQYKDGTQFGESLKKAQTAQAANAKKSGQQQEQADTRTAQQYYDEEITGAEKKREEALKELSGLESAGKYQYRVNDGGEINRQNRIKELKDAVSGYDSEISSKKKIYNQKKQAEKDENDKINARENNKRYAQKYDGASLNSLIQAYIDSDSDSEKDWIKEAIKSNKRVTDKDGNTTGFSSDEVESAMNNLYERGKEEADRVNAAYEYDGYKDTRQETINHFQSKYGDAAYMLENLLHGKRRSETKEKYTEEYKNAVNSKKYDNDSATWVQERDTRDDLDNKKYMTDEEYSVYTYLLNNRREDDAEKYFNAIKPELNQRMTQAQAQKEYELGNEGFGGAVLASLKSLGYNLASGGGFIEDVVNYATHNEIDTNSMLHMPSHLRDAERKGVNDLIGEDNPVGQWIYGTAMSVADNAINLAISKGIGKIGGAIGSLGKLSAGAETVNKISSTAASVIMGSQVATQTVIDCKDKGMDDGTAIGLGFIHGLVEHITEKVSIESILADPGNFKQSIAKSFISEGSEEVTANWVDRIADNLLLGDKSEEQQKYKELKAQGLSDTEAFTQVMLSAAGEDASAFFAGGISGVAMSGTSHAFNAGVKKLEEHSANKSLSRTYQAIAKEASKSKDFDEKKKELIEQAKSSGDEKARKMAESFERTIENNGGKLDSIKVEDVGNMLQVLDVGAQKQEVIDSAKNAGDTEVEKAATALEEKVKKAGGDYSAVTVWETLDLMKAVENVKQYKSSVGLNTDTTESTESEAKEPTAAESMVKAGGGYEAQEIRDSYTDSGLKSKRIGKVNLNAFGASRANGIEATSRSDKNVRFQISRIHSSARENNEGFNTVVLETADGRLVNADEVTLKSTALDTLLKSADNFDTNGARGLLANYEGYEKYCKKNGREADVHEYLKLYSDAYSLGRNNIRYESLKKVGSTRFNSIARAIGIEQAENALNTGANDVDERFKNENNAIQRLRMPGRRNAADSRVELDVNESFKPGYSDDQVMLLEAVAKKTGRSIVLTDKLESNVNGVFGKDGKIYINADMENSDYMISVALHEAVHGLRDSAPAEYNALEKFVVNYLVESGESVDEMLDDIKTKWKNSAPSEDIRREELVAQTVMALASNERALKTAVECKANRDLLKKALDAIKRIAQGVRTWIEGIKSGNRVIGAHNKQAQPWIEDVKALEKLAKLFSKYMDEQRVAVQETTQERNQGGVRYSFGGERARSADKTSLATAKQLDADGKNSEEIRQKTGWHKGYDGKWRFEIDDSMAKLVENPPLKLKGDNDVGYYRTAKLGDVLEHSKLFEAYPQLKDVTVIIQETEPGVEGISFNESKQIVLSQKLFERTTEEFKKLQESKQEEIKRIEQTKEYNEYNKYYQMDFSSVENPAQWLKEEKAARDKFFNSELGKRYYQLQWGKTNVQKTELGWSDKALSVLMHEVQHQIQKIEEFASGSNGKNKGYYNTAGEVEARDVQQRLNLNAEQRQKKRPDIDRDEVVFSEQNGESFEINELIKESEEEKINRLKKARVEYVTASNDSISKMSEIDVTNASSQQIEKLVFPLLSNFETFGTHYNKAYDVEFDYSRKSASRSISHQIRITGKDFSANAIVHANLKELCKTAYPVEVHEDEKPNNKAFESQKIKEIITLFNCLQVGKDAIFVKMTVKVPRSLNNRLHMVVTSEIKKGLDLVLLAEAYAKSGAVRSADKSNPTISIQTFLEKVKDIPEFTKRIPVKSILNDTIYDFKEKQNRIIQRSNPVDDDYHTWIRNAGDIKTFEETLNDSDYDEGEDFDQSYSWDMAQKALKSGKITVYSSYPISQGVFVTPSKMEAEDYAGGGRIFKKTVNLTDVAWIDPTQGQFAKVDEDEKIKHNDLRFAVDDEITDDLFSFDGDLFEEDNTKYLDEYIKTSPQEAVLSMYNSLAKTGESVVRGFKGVKLDEGNYLKAAKRLMKRYQIKQSLNPGIDSEIAQRIKEFVTEVNDNPNANYSEALNVLATDCKRFLLMSGDYDDTAKEIREQILGEIRGSTILLRPYEESQILESFGGMKNLKRAFFGKVNVGYERNKKKGGTYWYIEELVEHIREQLGKAYADESAVDSIEGWKNDYALKNDVHPFVVSYLSFKPAALHTQKAEEENMLFATPRSWVRVSDILHYDSNVENPVVRHKIIGNIGAAEGVQFVEHCKKQKRAVTADDFISGKVDAPKSPDMLFLLTNSVTSKADFIAQKDFSDFTPDEKKRLRDIISALFRMPVPDYTVIGVKELLSKNRTAVKQTFVTMDDIRIRRFLADNAEAFGLSREKGGRARLAMWGD